MKKFFIAATLLIGMVAGAMVLSSFNEPKENDDCIEKSALNVGVPTYWEGRAYYIPMGMSSNYIDIKVYQSEGQCNSYYAVVQKDNSEVWVKTNMNYDPSLSGTSDNARSQQNYYQYYVTYRNTDYRFNMR